MNNNWFVSLAVSVIPILAIGFVAILLLHKLYVEIRSKFNSTVNCWFCNINTKVPYLESNSWTCPHCEQYNGFTKDGDYNREMFQQLDCSNASTENRQEYWDNSSELFTSFPPRNGFCNVCNEAQRLKVEKLAQFEPKNESNFDEEVKAFKAQLEEQYRLCATCDRHLSKVLREKKKMVLGSKFLDFIIKGAETLKQPHFSQLRHAKRLQWKRHLTLLLILLAVVNICCLFSSLPMLTRDYLTRMLGERIGSVFFIACSHILALGRVVAAYLDSGSQHEVVFKVGLFLRTLFMMVLYSMGLKLPQVVHFSFAALYVMVAPFAMLVLAFGQNILDSFRLTRFTFLLVLWSFLAGGLFVEHLPMSETLLMFITSFLTLVLSTTCRVETSPKLYDITANSFHKIYSEDYFSDEETISLLSQQLNSSAVSVHSTNSSFQQRSSSPLQHLHLLKSPLTSSTRSLNQLPLHSQLSPNSSFKSFCLNDENRTVRPFYGSSICNLHNATISPRSSLYASNMELSSRERPHSVYGIGANTATANRSFANASFNAPRTTQHHNMDDEHYLLKSVAGKAGLYATQSAFPVVATATTTASLQTPFPVSSNAVYLPQRPTNLLTPSRFSTNCFAGNTATTSWLSGGYFNQQRQATHSAHAHEHRNGPMTVIDENLSRASSQSSGFESQNGRGVNYSRENSCPENAEVLQRTKSVLDSHAKSFRPIETRDSSLISPHCNNQTQPLSVNCYCTPSELWSVPLLRKSLHPRDSFNLRKIDEELPTVKRGDLLRKWKESQAIS